MDSTADSKHDTQSLSELEKGYLPHEIDGAEHSSNLKQNNADSSPGPATIQVNAADWNGDDDPDNPYNCEKLSSKSHSSQH
jgi:hypothetical protein